jgi:hypothetical protein
VLEGGEGVRQGYLRISILEAGPFRKRVNRAGDNE